MKKALSVFLSLLMVITTISVVFTLPASAAVVNYVINENFDSLAAGVNETRREFEGGNGWLRVGTTTTSANIVDLSTSAADYNNVTAASGSNILTMNSWSYIGYVFDVEPDTTYTLNFKWYVCPDLRDGEKVRAQVSVNDVSSLSGNVAEAHRGKVLGSVSGTSTALKSVVNDKTFGSWETVNVTFTTGAHATKYYVSFTHENNDPTAGLTAAQKALYIDDFAISYEAKPVIKAATYGADTQNGGEAWVVTDKSGDVNENDAITYKARPYDSALFDGFYSVVGTTETKITDGVTDNGDGSYTLTNRPWNLSEKIIAKFEALAKNMYTDPSFANDHTIATPGKELKNDNGNVWPERTYTTAEHIINTKGWVGTKYGDGHYVYENSTYTIGSSVTTPTAISGKSMFSARTGGWHGIGRVVPVEANKNYTLTYYYYATSESVGLNSNGNDWIVGISTQNMAEDGTIPVVESSKGTPGTDATNGHRQLKVTFGANDSKTTYGQWVKRTIYFNSEEFTRVYIPWWTKSLNLFIDHVSLYVEPEAVTPTVNSVSNFGSNDGVVDGITSVYYEGDTFTATAKPYDNARFVGWFVDEEMVSTNPTYTLTYYSNKTYTAKFHALTENLFPNASGEDFADSLVLKAGNAFANSKGIYYGTGTTSAHYAQGVAQTAATIFEEGATTSANVYKRPIASNGWIGASYGDLHVADDSFIDSKIDGLTAYSGNTAYVHRNANSHYVGKVIRGLKPHTQYKVSFYSLVSTTDKANPNDNVANATTNYGITGIETGATEMYWRDQYTIVGANYGNQTRLEQSATVDERGVAGKWVKYERTFTTGNFTDVLINFSPANVSGAVTFFDHVSLYEVPVAFAPTITVDDGGKNAGIVYDVTKVYEDGDKFNATAKAYDNGTFLGWYVGDVLVSTDLTAKELTYYSNKTYTAKFTANYPNIFPDSSFENQNVLAEGSTFAVDNTFTPRPSDSDTTTQIGTDGWTVGRWGGVNFAYGNTTYANSEIIPDAYTGNVVFRNLTAWAESYRILAVEPNTQYIFTAMVYETDASTKFNAYDGNSHKVRGITDAEYEAGAVNLVGAASNSLATTNYLATTKTHTAKVGEWVKYTVEFNSGSFNYVALPFGHCGGKVYIDDAVLYEIPVAVDLDSKVQIDSGEYSNAGLVDVEGEVYFDGDKFTIAVTPYANATLDGVYVDGEKLTNGVVTNETTTYEVTYAEASTYVVKFNAFADNIFPDASFEGITPSTTTYYVPGAGSGVKNGENPILANGWISSVYGHAYVANSEQLAGKGFENVKAYAGNNVLFTDCPSHQVYRLLEVEANTRYKMVYYVFAPEGAAVNVDYVYGIKPDGNTVTWLDMNPAHGGETGQSQIPVTVNNYTATAGQWIRREVTFNTGAHTRVLIPFASNPVLFDHVTVYKLPNPTTVSIGVAGGNLLVNGKYVNNASYEVGEQVTVTAVPYEYIGNEFLGWYTDASCTGEAYSKDATLSVVATDGATYFAKFKNNNIVNDAGFENFALGEITNQTATTGYGKIGTANLYVTDSVVGFDDLSAYSGNNMLKVSAKNATIYYNAGAVKPYTTYKVNFKMLLPTEGQEVTDWRTSTGKRIVEFAGVRPIDARTTSDSRPDINPINGNQYDAEHTIIVYHTVNDIENSAWKEVTAIISSYEYNELMVGFGYYGTTSDVNEHCMYIDDFTIAEVAGATATVETVNPFGGETTLTAGGYAIAKNSYKELGKATLVATPNNGGIFLGWYLNGEKVSSSATYEVEISESVNYVAKFATNGFNDVVSAGENLLKFDGSFEEYAAGTEVIKIRQLVDGAYNTNGAPVFDRGSEHFTLGAFSEWGRIFATTRYAYEGNNSLYLNRNCNAAFVMKLGESGTETALEPNTEYVLSFYYMVPEAKIGSNGNPEQYIQQIGVVEEGFNLNKAAGTTDYKDSKEDENGKKLLHFQYHQSETVYGEWTRIDVPFTTTETAGATLSMVFTATATNIEEFIYLDNFELKKAEVYDVAVNTAFNNSVERGGVAIRLPDAEGTVTQALRFKARIAKERLEAMTLGADYKVVEYGSLAMNSAYIEGDSLVEKANNLAMTLDEDGNKVTYTNGGKNAVIGVTYNANSGANKVFAYKPGERDLIFTAALTGIGKGMEGDNLAKAYTTTYVVRTYAILELADGTKVVVHDDVTADETFQASIYDVATKAMVDPKVSDVDKEYIQKQIIDVCEAASEEGVASSYSSSFTGKGLSNEEEIENMFVDENIIISGDQGGHVNSAPTFYTSDNTIRVYKDNTLTLSAPTASTYALRSTGIVRIIKSVEITYKSSDVDGGDADPTATANVGTVTYSEDENKLTISDINASEVVITFNGKAKIINIKVNYTEQAPCTEHVYTDNCDEACDNCYAVRYDAPHNFVSDCDAVCDCGETREATGEHTYKFVCSTECSVCGATREANHVYTDGYCDCGAKEPTEKTVSVVVEDYATANSWANGTKYTSVTIAKNSNEETIVSATASGKSSSGDTGKYYTSGKDWRFYQTDDSKLTISATAGYIIKSVKVTYSNSNSGVLLNGTEQAASGDVVLVNAQSITLKVGNKGTATNGQARITAIEVVYDIIPECAPEDHIYDNSCDTSCNVCNAQRAATHEDDAVLCDTKCSVCGEAVVATAQHTADACASACELCGAEVVPTHKFAGDCDAVCECGVERDVNAEHNYVDGACDVCGALEPVSCTHEYDNACDAECNLCFATREDITHTYISECDTTCEYCDATREAAEHATYDNACDTTCICGAERVAPHNFTNDCQTKCADCDVTREPLADHTWTDDCDAACDICGETRTAPHQYEFPCSAECVCGATRTPAEHDFTNGDCVCGEPKPTSTTVNVKVQNYASANNWANGTKYSSIVLDSNITATVSSGTNTGKYYTSGYEWRLYQTESAKITISAANGMIIKTIKITYNVSNTGVLKLNGSNVASGSVVTVNASSIQFTVGNSGSATNGQAKITAIEVVYGEACNHTDDKVACDTICSECGMTVDPTAEHTYADDCDANCELCNTVRTAPHVAASDCDLACENCGADLVPTAEHTYDDDADADCNLCGDVRVPPVSCDHANADACDTVCPDCDVDLVPAHKWASECDTTCDCGETREALADHDYADDCDADCDLCGETRTAPHQYEYDCSDTCVCGATRTPADHTYGEDGFCECGEEKPAQGPTTLATFEFGDNVTAGSKNIDSNSTSLSGTKTYTENGYNLKLEGISRVYDKCYDDLGNSCLKLGSSSKAGTFNFTVADNVTKVIIRVKGYKSSKSIISVNGTNTTINANSSTTTVNGQCLEIEVDTSTNKTVSITTVTGGWRIAIDSIEFVGISA